MIATGPDEGDGEAIDLRDRDRAREVLRRLMKDPANAAALRAALVDAAPGTSVHRVSDAAVSEQLSAHVAAGRAVLLTPGEGDEDRFSGGVEPAAEKPPPPPPPPPQKTRRKTWVKFKVVDDATDAPVPSVRLRITTPDGLENFYTTSASGMIEINDIEPGMCEAVGELKDALLTNTLHFVATGEAKAGGAPASGGDGGQPDGDGASNGANGAGGGGGGGGAGIKRIAEIEARKVTKKDSIASLAKEAGLTWQALAKFNWGTDVPDQINKHLRDVVGCTKKTQDGHNYMFDESDDPGIVLIPHVWERTDLETANTHILRVRRVLVTRFRVLYYEDSNYILPNADYTILDDDGAIVASGASDERARVRLPDSFRESWPIVLGRPRRVIGTVLTAGDRRPVAEQTMTVRTLTRRVQSVTSGADGRIAILRVPEGSLAVSWEGQEAVIFVDRDIDDALFLLDAPPGTEDPEAPDEHEALAAESTPAVLTLSLVDPENQPLAGAAVRVTQGGAEVFSGAADGAGKVLVTGHDPEQPCDVHVEGHGTMAVAGAHGDGHDEDGELPEYDPGEAVVADDGCCGGEYTCA